jgi:hypothetical protein
MAAAPALEHFCHCAETRSRFVSHQRLDLATPASRRRTITYRPVRRRLRATHLKSGLHFPLPWRLAASAAGFGFAGVTRIRGVDWLDWPCGQNPGRKPEGHQRAIWRARRMSLGEQDSTCRASSLSVASGTEGERGRSAGRAPRRFTSSWSRSTYASNSPSPSRSFGHGPKRLRRLLAVREACRTDGGLIRRPALLNPG